MYQGTNVVSALSASRDTQSNKSGSSRALKRKHYGVDPSSGIASSPVIKVPFDIASQGSSVASQSSKQRRISSKKERSTPAMPLTQIPRDRSPALSGTSAGVTDLAGSVAAQMFVGEADLVSKSKPIIGKTPKPSSKRSTQKKPSAKKSSPKKATSESSTPANAKNLEDETASRHSAASKMSKTSRASKTSKSGSKKQTEDTKKVWPLFEKKPLSQPSAPASPQKSPKPAKKPSPKAAPSPDPLLFDVLCGIQNDSQGKRTASPKKSPATPRGKSKQEVKPVTKPAHKPSPKKQSPQASPKASPKKSVPAHKPSPLKKAEKPKKADVVVIDEQPKAKASPKAVAKPSPKVAGKSSPKAAPKPSPKAVAKPSPKAAPKASPKKAEKRPIAKKDDEVQPPAKRAKKEAKSIGDAVVHLAAQKHLDAAKLITNDLADHIAEGVSEMLSQTTASQTPDSPLLWLGMYLTARHTGDGANLGQVVNSVMDAIKKNNKPKK